MRARNRSSASSSAGCGRPVWRRRSATPGAGRSRVRAANWRRASSPRRALRAPPPARRWHSDWAQVPASEVGDVVSSQGQRFRRRALRRGYKVDEVDAFLDRVEGTLAGDPVSDAPVSAQEVHDVVFRVRFGGYDEWQVDLHLDRVERQLAEFEERGGGRAPAPRMQPETMRGGMPADRMGPSMGRSAPPTERLPAPMRDDRPMGPPQMPQRQQMPAPDPYGPRYDEPAYEEPGYGQQPQRPGPAGYDTGGYQSF